ncbi:MAG: ion transporter [Candidatus Promineifilaceae bacterium]
MSKETNAENTNLDQGGARRNGASYDLFILVLTIFSLIVVALILIWPLSRTTEAVLVRVDFLICGIFLADFLLNFWRAPSKTGYFFMGGGWLDLLGSVPIIHDLPWTAILRFARLSRSIRIVKQLRARDRRDVLNETRRSRAQSALLATLLVAIVLITIVSLVVLQVERGAPGANIKTGTDAYWWAFVTMTTVGYGDYVPVTLTGRVMAMILMTFGVGIFAVLTGFLATKLLAPQEDEREGEQDMSAIVREEMAAILREEMDPLRQENSAMRAELAELTALLKQQGSKDSDSI